MQVRDRVKELRRVSAKDLIPNPRNWRTHPKKQQDAMKSILAEIGYADALLAVETPEGLMLVDGHLRAETTPDTEVPVLVLDLTMAEADKMLTVLDPVAAMAGRNDDILSSLLSGMKESGDVLTGMVWPGDVLAGLLKSAKASTEKNDELEQPTPEPPQEAKAQRGDLIIMGNHRLLCGDSMNPEDVALVLGGRKINVAVTSPPYASQRKYDEASGFKPVKPDDYVNWYESIAKSVFTHLAPDGSYFLNIKEHCEDGQRHLYVTDLLQAHVRQWGWSWVDTFCWKDTKNGVPGGWNNRFKDAWEPVFHFSNGKKIKFDPHVNGKQSENVFNYKENRVKSTSGSGFVGPHTDTSRAGVARPSNVIELPAGGTGEHSAQFPAELPAWFIRAFSDANDLVFDPFMGSGSTLIAAENEGRHGFGIEISPKYVDVCVMRWQNLTKKTAEGWRGNVG